MQSPKHLGLKLSVIGGFLITFILAWLSFWWLGDNQVSLQHFLYFSLADGSQSYWQWSRIMGVLSYVALWLSVMTGLSITSQSSSFWFERGTALSWHQFFTWLGLSGVGLHAGLLSKDSYLHPRWGGLLIPFNMQNAQLSDWAWVWAGLGQTAWYAMLVIAIGSLMKQKIAKSVWRYLRHYVALAQS